MNRGAYKVLAHLRFFNNLISVQGTNVKLESNKTKLILGLSKELLFHSYRCYLIFERDASPFS